MNPTSTLPMSRSAARPLGAHDPELPDHVRNLYTYTSSSLVGNLIGAIVIVLLYAGFAAPAALILWCLGFSAVWIYRA